LVAYAPLGRGLLTGKLRTTAALGAADLRRRVPRFDAGNFERNLALVDALASLAREHGCTPGQLALAWILAQGDDVIALPGCERVVHVEENAAAAGLRLDARTAARLHALFAPESVAGSRLRDSSGVSGG
jgi:aryl-alcohol dehydrogenase-like predicted oxidoreductase